MPKIIVSKLAFMFGIVVVMIVMDGRCCDVSVYKVVVFRKARCGMW